MTGDRMEFLRPALLHGEGGDAGATTVDEIMEHRLLDTYITEEELWACTSCRACVHGVPGLDRPARHHQRDAPQPRAHGVALPRGAAAGVRVARAQRLAVGVQPGRPRQVGRGDGHPDDGRAARSAASARTCCSGSAAWARSTTAPRRSPSPSRASSQACGIRFAILGQEETLPRRPGAPHGQRVPVPDAGEGHDRDARPLRGDRRSSRTARTASTRSATSSRSSAATTR